MGDPIAALREVHTELSLGSTVSAVALSNGNYGLQLVNKVGEKTRFAISDEAAKAIVANLTKVINGEGDTPVHSLPTPTWRVVRNPEREEEKRE